MTIPEEQRDRWFDENLRNLVDRHYGSCAPKPDQISRWVGLAKKSKRPMLLRIGGFLKEHPLGSMLSTAAAAAVIILAVVITFNASSPEISAAEVFSQLDRTLNECPIISISGKGIEFGGHSINIRFCGSDGGNLLYGEIKTSPLKNNTGDNITADMVFACNGDRGWLLIRRFECNGDSPFSLLLEEGESLLIDLPIPSKSKNAVRSAFPQLVRVADIRGLVASLQEAAPDLKTIRRNEYLTQLQGIITVPDKLIVGNLHESIDVSSRMHQRIIPAAGDFYHIESSHDTEADVNDEITDAVVGMVMKQLQDARKSFKKIAANQRAKGLRRMLVDQLKGAKITVSYEPEKKLLRSVTLTDIGPSRGFLKIHFYGKTFDDSLFSSDRFEKNPKVRVLKQQ